MGKIRRIRQKFHLASSRDHSRSENRNMESSNEEETDKPTLPITNLSPSENIFAGIDINVDQLRKTLMEDDRVSVRSMAKSCKYDSKGKLLTKVEKRRLRHTLFLQKIDAIQQLAREAKKKKNKLSLTSPNFMDPASGKQSVQNKKPCVQTEYKKHERIKVKGIKKTKQRQKLMVDSVAAFRKILHSPTFKSNPCGVISEIVQKAVYEETHNVK